jgi:Dullard-like phosphatase family protein
MSSPPQSPVSTMQSLLQEKKRDFKLPQIIKLAAKSPKLHQSSTRPLNLPDLAKSHSPSPRKLSPILAHSSSPPSPPALNLDLLLQREAKLSSLAESLQTDFNINAICVEYWELSNDDSFWGVEKWSNDSRTRKALTDSVIVDSLAVALLIFCSGNIGEWAVIANQVKSLVHFLHQNLLTFAELVLGRIPSDVVQPAWISEAREMIKSKQIRQSKRSEPASILRQYNEIIANCIRTVIRLMPIKSTPAISMILHILANRDKFSIPVARNYVMQQPSENHSSTVPPFLPEIKEKEMCLVLDLDETLVHYSIQGTMGQLLVRPYCQEFLATVAEKFEVVVFTAGLQEVRIRQYADWAIDIIDAERTVKHRLYRQHTLQLGPNYIKDLSRIGRDLKKTVIVDNMPANFQLQPDNGIHIRSWIGDTQDTALQSLALTLTGTFHSALADQSPADIRQLIRAHKDSPSKADPDSMLNLSM